MSLAMATVWVPQVMVWWKVSLAVMVLGLGLSPFWQMAWWVEMFCWFTGSWGVGRLWCRRVSLVMLMVVVVLVLLMPLARML